MEDEKSEGLGPKTSSVAKGQIAYFQGEPGDSWYEVVSGFMMLCHFFGDGRRQIFRFAGPGDAFGFEIGQRQSSAEALTDAKVIRHPLVEIDRRQEYERFSGSHPALQRALRAVEETIQLFSYGHADERIVAFLLKFGEHADQPGLIELPMSRQDLADHLGLTMHTISRSISELARRGFFVLEKPDRLRIIDRAGMESLVQFEGVEQHAQLVA